MSDQEVRTVWIRKRTPLTLAVMAYSYPLTWGKVRRHEAV